MQSLLPLDPDVADIAPTERALTPYDQEHAITYIRMLDADAEGAAGRRYIVLAFQAGGDALIENLQIINKVAGIGQGPQWSCVVGVGWISPDPIDPEVRVCS